MSQTIVTHENFTDEEALDLVDKIYNFTELLCFTPPATGFYGYQKEFARAIILDVLMSLGNSLTGLFARQSGKDLDIDTPILTPDGWKTMGTIEVGDLVFGSQGQITTVISTSEVFQDHKCYEIEFSDRSSLIAGEDHLWVVNEGDTAKTLSTKQLIEAPYRFRNKRNYYESKFKISTKASLELERSEQPVFPYILGYWLGDGHTNDNVITVGNHDKQAFLTQLLPGYRIISEDTCASTAVDLRFHSPAGKSTKDQLRKLGVLGNKHIPACYMWAAEDQRKALLAGLMDSAGSIYVYKSPSPRAEYGTKVKQLAEDVLLLVRSLGQKATIIEVESKFNGKNCGTFYKVCWTPTFNPFRLERKRAIWKAPLTDRVNWVQIRNITAVPTRSTRCIQVDAPDHIYLVGKNLIPTHNSECVANVAAALMVILPKLANFRNEDHTFLFPQLRGFASGYKVGIFAPSGLQATTTYARLRDRLTSPNGRMFLDSPEFALEGYDSLLPFISNKADLLQLNNGSFCRQLSADKQSKIESQTFHLILLDESQDLDAYVVGKSIGPMGASTNATTVATGTPGITKGYFYNAIADNKRDQIDRKRSDRRIQPQLHFEYDYKEVQKWNKNYEKYVKKEKKKLGEDSDEYQQAYCLRWLLERGMAVPESLFDALTRKDLNIVTSYKQEELVAGLDWGKSQDSTVLTVGRPLWDQVDESGRAPVEVLNWWHKLGDSYEEILAELKHELDKYSIRTLACDATGSGEPLADRLIWDLPHITVLPVKFSSQSKDHLYKWFLLMLQEHKVWWPGLSEVRKRKYWLMFQDQMLNLVKEYKGQFLACHAPEDQRNAHDDFPDSLALMLWCLNEEAMPFVQVQNADPSMYKANNWYTNPKGGGFSLR